MELCNDGHDQICYDDGTCPLCAKMDEMRDAVEKSRKEGHDEGYDEGLHDA